MKERIIATKINIFFCQLKTLKLRKKKKKYCKIWEKIKTKMKKLFIYLGKKIINKKCNFLDGYINME